MQVVFASAAEEDRAYWEKTNPDILKRINKLIADIQQRPYTGLGKPEPLKFEKSGYWSRRINRELRLIYKIANEKIYIAQCRYHY